MKQSKIKAYVKEKLVNFILWLLSHHRTNNIYYAQRHDWPGGMSVSFYATRHAMIAPEIVIVIEPKTWVSEGIKSQIIKSKNNAKIR